MRSLRCSKCDLMLLPGDERFVVSIHVASDSEDSFCHHDTDRTLAQLLECYESDEDEECEAEDGCFAFTLCGKCRRTFLSNPLNVQAPTHLDAARFH